MAYRLPRPNSSRQPLVLVVAIRGWFLCSTRSLVSAMRVSSATSVRSCARATASSILYQLRATAVECSLGPCRACRWRVYCRSSNPLPANHCQPPASSDSLVSALGFDREVDSGLRDEIRKWVEMFIYNVEHPPPDAKFVNDLCPAGSRPMRSLRDVEEQIPVIGLMR